MAKNKGEHERDQDARITANAEAIRNLTEYLRDIRNHFIPEENARLRRLAKYVVTPVVKAMAVIAFIGGLWDVMLWWHSRHEVRSMAQHYAEVAKDLYSHENNPEIAKGFLDRAIDLCDDNAEYRFLRAYIEGMGAVGLVLNLDRPYTKVELDRLHHAYAEAKFLEGLKPNRAEPYLLQAQALLALKEVDRAEELLAKAKGLDPKNDFVHLRLAQLYLDFKKDIPQTERELAIVESLAPKSKWLWLWRGLLANDYKKDPVKARACYDKALAVDPKFEQALNNYGWTWMRPKTCDYAKARAAFKQVLAINPAFKEACYAIGISYGYEDNYPVAKMWLDKAIAIDGQYLTAYKWRGVVNEEMSEFEAAVADFDMALRLDPENADLYVRRARAYERLGKLKEALRDLRFAEELAPRASRTQFNLGNIFMKFKNPATALVHFEKAIALEAEYDDAWAAKAVALQALGRKEEMLEAIDRAIAVCKYKPERHMVTKGTLQVKSGDEEGALASFVKARTVNPKCEAAWKQESHLAEKLGKIEPSQQALRKYLELVPTDVDEKARLKKW